MDKTELLEKLKKAQAAKKAADMEKAEKAKAFLEKFKARAAEIRAANEAKK